MTEIKAYVRVNRIDQIVHMLKRAGIPHMSMIHVWAVGSAIDPTESKISIELASRVTDVVKIEIVCPETLTEEVISIIEREGRTGRPGDGIIYVSSVDAAVKVRTGERGASALT